MSPGEAVVQSLKTQQDHGCLPQTVFTPILPQALSSHFIESALEDINRFWPLFDTKLILTMMEEQYIAGLDNYHQDPPRGATLNAFLALGIRWKAASSAIGDLFPISWAYFKNAFSIFPQLLIQGKDLHACRAVLVMAMFMQGTGDTRAASSLISAAAHLSRVVGLHNRDLYLDMDLGEAEQHRRVFWMIHIISNDIAMKGGPSALLRDDHVDIELPSKTPPDGVGNLILPGANLLRYMAQLSIIQSRILKELCDVKASRQSLDMFSKDIEQLDRQLEDWKTGLPQKFQPRPNTALSETDLELSITHLHLTYYATTLKLHTAMSYYERYTRLSHELVKRAAPRRELSSIPYSSPSPMDGARASIHLALHASSQSPFPQLWQTLCHTITAALVLVANVLDDPSKPDSPLNVDLLCQLVSHLELLGSHGGYALQDIGIGVSRLYKVALYAVSTSQDTLLLEGPGSGGAGLATLDEHCKHIRAGLSETVDLMHVSLGLTGNMPHLYAKAANLFPDIFGMSSNSTNGFGPFVPTALQPSHYNFDFAPR